MFKLVIISCLVLNPYVCKAPIEIVPATGDISGMTACLMGGASFQIESGVEWFIRVECRQADLDFDGWLEAYKRKHGDAKSR